MSSERRIRASRANGAKSSGPKTPESKARSVANNLRHGLLARTVVLDDENVQAFSDLLKGFDAELNPQNSVQRALVENLAVSRWRLLRLWAVERFTMKAEMDKHDPATNDPGVRAAWAFRSLSDGSRSLDLLNRYETRFDRQYERCLNLMPKMGRPAKPVSGQENVFDQTNLVPFSDTPALWESGPKSIRVHRRSSAANVHLPLNQYPAATASHKTVLCRTNLVPESDTYADAG